jgi:hypothetical protein
MKRNEMGIKLNVMLDGWGWINILGINDPLGKRFGRRYRIGYGTFNCRYLSWGKKN